MANESINNDKNPSLKDDTNEKRNNSSSPLYWPKKKEDSRDPDKH